MRRTLSIIPRGVSHFSPHSEVCTSHLIIDPILATTSYVREMDPCKHWEMESYLSIGCSRQILVYALRRMFISHKPRDRCSFLCAVKRIHIPRSANHVVPSPALPTFSLKEVDHFILLAITSYDHEADPY